MRLFHILFLSIFAMHCAAKLQVNLIVDHSGNYQLSVVGSTGTLMQLPSGKTWFRNANQVAALHVTAISNTSGVDGFGRFTATHLTWTGPSGFEVVTSFTEYPSQGDMVVFTQYFPLGAKGTTSGDDDSLASSFPSFLLPQKQPTNPVGFAHFSGPMAGSTPQFGQWTQLGSLSLGGGMANSGLLALFRQDLATTVLISPLDNFMSASLQNANATAVEWGIMGGATEIPVGYKSSWILVAVETGVNKAVREWGARLRHFYHRDRKPHDRDPTLQYLTYSTDNGAFYYYYTANFTNYQDVLTALKADAKRRQLPYRAILLDSWWYFRGQGGGVMNWTARPDVFPGGMGAAHEITQWMIQAHNRYWSPDNVYASNPQVPPGPTNYSGKKFEFAWGDGLGLPTTFEFWDYFFSLNEDWGLRVYEQDWLSTVTTKMPQLNQNVTFGADWLRQMGNAANAHGLAIQYCMSFPRHVFTALELPAVTQARGSNDYLPQSELKDTDQWKLGESALWTDALGIAVSKDDFWTMPSFQYQPKYDSIFYSFETRNRLQCLAALMTNGPVEPSDQINYTDRELIMRTCNDNGLLLRPDFAAATLDRGFVANAFGSAGSNGYSGSLHATHSTISGLSYTYLLAANVAAPFFLEMSNILSSQPTIPEQLPIQHFLYFETNATDAVGIFSPEQQLPIAVSNEITFQYFTLVPVLSNTAPSYLLMGELSKWISVSQQRVEEITLTEGGVKVVVRGVVGESVTLGFVHSSTLKRLNVTCVISEALVATFVVNADATTFCKL